MNAPLQASGLGLTHPVRREWLFASAILSGCFILLGLVFNQEFAGAVRVWIGSQTYNHCFLILPIAGYMIWQRRHAVAGLSPTPDLRALLLILPLSLAWFAASVINVLEAQQFIVMTIFQAMLLGVLGWPVYRKLIYPFLYLYFLVPSGEFLVPALQDFTARFAVLGLQLSGIPVYSDGILIEVPAGAFAVAEACAGLRFLIAALAFGFFYASETYRSPVRRAIFIALSVVVPIIANGFRAFGLIIAAQFLGSAAAIEADHVTFGWVFFSIVLFALVLIGRSFSDRDHEEPAPASVALREVGSADIRGLSFAGVLAAGMMVTGPVFGMILDQSLSPRPLPDAPPSVAFPWALREEENSEWRPSLVRTDRTFTETFSNGTDIVDRFVALYSWRGRTNNLIRSDNRISDEELWRTTQRGRSLAEIEGQPIRVNRAEIVSGARRQLVWWFYALDEATAASLPDVKRLQVHAYFAWTGCPSAMIAVATDMSRGPEEAERALRSYLDAMEPLPGYLCSNGRGAP